MKQNRYEMAKRNEAAEVAANPDQVQVMAYQLWLDRGCPNGSDQEDWFRAELELRNSVGSVQVAA